MEMDISLGWLTVNRACDNRCSWCYAQDSKFDSESMSRKDAKALIKFMAELGIKKISLIGGEPNLYRDLFYVLNLILHYGIDSLMTTNGRRFSDIHFAKQIAKSGISNISISLKGINREQYNQLTNTDGFDEACQGIKNLAELGSPSSVFFTFGVDALEQIDETLEFLSSLEVKSIVMNFANPVIINGEAHNKDAPNPLQIADAYSKIIGIIPKVNKNVFLAPSIPLCLLSPEIRTIAIKRKMLTGTCYARTGTSLIFSPKGEVIPCHQFASHYLGKFGVDFTDTESFREFWSSDSCLEFRRMMNNFPSVECINCADWEFCFGGCPIKWFYFQPMQYIKRMEA